MTLLLSQIISQKPVIYQNDAAASQSPSKWRPTRLPFSIIREFNEIIGGEKKRKQSRQVTVNF